MNISKKDFEVIASLYETVTTFNERHASLYENCKFRIEPRYFILNDSMLGFDLYYGNEFLRYRTYIGLKFLAWIIDEGRLHSFLKERAEKYAHDYYERIGY